ncbi:uncharacterized protein PADG_00148 [Paracoccidioides brasiliensis Pb18]|uniref:FAD-binding PCMH-type domain-containing protein n=1 Tax=Paracoccidioides brasiliensis (strain Pb18) TaxID=502780 RepID=C1FZV8_PARBD|nr:uncharacterized protein PADG_00148 [Paracoccidioides brasiliensis Pb18]EEH43859.1 hypothetical protein PADG_00148 [Paracoccidioides brasiliensis Pb18]
MSTPRSKITADLVSTLGSRLQNTKVVTETSPDYGECIARWSDTAVKRAGVVLFPSTAQDISIVVKFVQEHNIDLAVKCGGHSVSGTSSSDGGIVIDLGRMRGVTVDAATKVITAQGGALWADVDNAAAEYGLATVGGTVNHTGIGGLTLGGGYGWLSGRYGMVVDNLLSANLVLADGSVVTASSTENPDLFWAVRGAGHGFGIAVEFQYRCYEQKGEVFSGLLTFTPDKLELVLDFLNSLSEELDANTAAVFMLGQPPGALVPIVAVAPIYIGPEEEARNKFKPLFALGPELDKTYMMPYVKLNALFADMTAYGGRKTFKGTFFLKPVRPAFVRSILDNFTTKLQSDSDLLGSAIVLEFMDMRKVCEVPLSSTAVANRSMNTLNGIVGLRWKESSNDAQHREYARQLQALFKEELDSQLKERNITPDGVPQYLNYAEPGDIAVPEIFGDNTTRLQKLKAQYDPGCLFSKMLSITPVT